MGTKFQLLTIDGLNKKFQLLTPDGLLSDQQAQVSNTLGQFQTENEATNQNNH